MAKLSFEAKGEYLIAQSGMKVYRIEPLAWAYLEVIDLAGSAGKFETVGEFNDIAEAKKVAEGMA